MVRNFGLTQNTQKSKKEVNNMPRNLLDLFFGVSTIIFFFLLINQAF